MFILKESHDGIMVAFMLPSSISQHITNSVQDVTFPKGSTITPYQDHHITLLYFENGTISIPQLTEVLQQFAYDLQDQYVDFFLNGIGMFTGEDQDCLYIPVYDGSNTQGIKAFQRELCTRIGYAMGVGNELLYRYNKYTPHVTVAYIPKGSPVPYGLDTIMTGVYMTMESFSLVNGNDRKDFKFNFNI